MSFWDKFESKQDGIEDTIEFTIRIAVTTLAMVILVVVLALVSGLFVSDSVISNDKIFEMIGPAFNTIVGAFVGLLGGLSLNANARNEAPVEPTPPAPEEPLELTEPAPEPTPPPAPATFVDLVEEAPAEDDDDDDDMAPWEKYRNDLRYDANGDGVVDESDFPDWRSAGQ